MLRRKEVNESKATHRASLKARRGGLVQHHAAALSSSVQRAQRAAVQAAERHQPFGSARLEHQARHGTLAPAHLQKDHSQRRQTRREGVSYFPAFVR